MAQIFYKITDIARNMKSKSTTLISSNLHAKCSIKQNTNPQKLVEALEL